MAVLLNLEPDHLDRHGTFADYVAAKLRIFANQGNDDVAVAPVDLDVEDLGGCARRVPFGAAGAELSDRAGYLWWDDEPLIDVTEISLPGAHNRANAMAVAAACLARGIDRDAVAAGLRTFPGVAHRLELIATRDGVAFVNDSKATNVASTLVALRSYAGGIHLIAGGRGKRQDFSPLAPVVAERCRAVYLIGEAAAGPRARRWRRPASRSARRASSPPPCRPRPPRPRPETPSCSHRPAPAMTSTRTSRLGATTSASSWRSSGRWAHAAASRGRQGSG